MGTRIWLRYQSIASYSRIDFAGSGAWNMKIKKCWIMVGRRLLSCIVLLFTGTFECT